MKTTAQMIEIMQAFEEGKKIEWCDKENYIWEDIEEPKWDWIGSDYRVKKELKFRPYKDTEEMIDDFCKRFGVIRKKFGEPFIWVKTQSCKHLIINIYQTGVEIDRSIFNMSDLYNQFTFLDGSPCGIKE